MAGGFVDEGFAIRFLQQEKRRMRGVRVDEIAGAVDAEELRGRELRRQHAHVQPRLRYVDSDEDLFLGHELLRLGVERVLRLRARRSPIAQ